MIDSQRSADTPVNPAFIRRKPPHWGLAPLFAVARPRNTKNVGMREDNLLSLSYGRIVRRDINTNEGLLPESFETYQIVEPGDSVFRLTDLQNDQRSLRTALVSERGIITSAYLVLEPTGVLPEYFAYLVRAYDHDKTFYRMGSGLRQSLKFEELRRLPVLVPPYEEQRRIAAFLDHETARIDELVREQKRLEIQSKELFAAQMAAALTMGVRDSPDLRTTDVPWIPQIKSDWQLVPFKRLVVLQRGFDLPQENRVSGSVPVVSSGGVIDRHNVAVVKGPGIVTGRYGTIGEVAFVAEDYWPLNTALYSREFHGNSVRFAFHVLRWLKPQVESLSAKAAVSGVDRNDLHRLLIPLPPVEEQEEIAAFLDESLVELDKLMQSLDDLVAHLMERRSALISAAVTRQLDLRNWQPPELEAVAEVA